MDLLVRSGDLVALILPNQLGMTISKEDHIHLKIPSIPIQHMVIILRIKCLQEATLVGSRGLQPPRRDLLHRPVMITMVGKGAMQPHHLHNYQILCILMLLALAWAPHLPRQVTIMDSHKLPITDIQLRIRKLVLPRRAMAMVIMKGSTKTRGRPSTHMGDMLLSHQLILKVQLTQAMVSKSNMVSHHPTTCHNKDLMPILMVSRGLVSLEMCLIKVPSQLRNHMVRMPQLNSSLTHMRQVGQCSKLILCMVLRLLMMGIIRLPLLLVILSKERNQLLVTLRLVDNRHRAMLRLGLLQVMASTLLLKQVLLNKQLRTMQVMGIKEWLIRRMVLLRVPLMVHLQLVSQLIPNQPQLSQAMISQSHSQVGMQMYQLVMGKVCRPSQVILSMMLVRCMLGIVDNLDNVFLAELGRRDSPNIFFHSTSISSFGSGC